MFRRHAVADQVIHGSHNLAQIGRHCIMRSGVFLSSTPTLMKARQFNSIALNNLCMKNFYGTKPTDNNRLASVLLSARIRLLSARRKH